MRENSSNKQVLLSILGVAILVVAVVGVSFAAFTFSQAGVKENTISTGTISMSYVEGTAINITNAMPISDDAGKVLSGSNEKFNFTVSASITGTATINWEIAAVKKPLENDEPTIADEDIRLYLTRMNGEAEEQVFAPAPFTPLASSTSLGSPSGSMVIASGSYNATTTDSYILRMWMAESAVVDGTSKSYTVTVNVYAKAV